MRDFGAANRFRAPGAERPRMTLENFKPMRKRTLRGFCVVRLPSGLVIADIAIDVSHGRAWAHCRVSRSSIARGGTSLMRTASANTCRSCPGPIARRPIAGVTP